MTTQSRVAAALALLHRRDPTVDKLATGLIRGAEYDLHRAVASLALHLAAAEPAEQPQFCGACNRGHAGPCPTKAAASCECDTTGQHECPVHPFPKPKTALAELREVPGATGANAEPDFGSHAADLRELRLVQAERDTLTRAHDILRANLNGTQRTIAEMRAVVEAAQRLVDADSIDQPALLHELDLALSALDNTAEPREIRVGSTWLDRSVLGPSHSVKVETVHADGGGVNLLNDTGWRFAMTTVAFRHAYKWAIDPDHTAETKETT